MQYTIRIRKRNLLSIVFGLSLVMLFMGVAFRHTERTYSQTCMTRAQVSSDNRCLYIVDSVVYSKGSRSSPHHGHPCGTDVTSVIPSGHKSNIAKFLTPNKIGTVCALPTPTAIPPTSTPLPSATSFPTKTVPTQSIFVPTATPTQPGVSIFPTSPQLVVTPLPTATVFPTPTQIPGSSAVSLILRLHGIGAAGDNVSANAFGTSNPLHPQRTVTVSLYTTGTSPVLTVSGVVTYLPTNGVFVGTISLGTGLSNGSYLMKVVTHPYLQKQAPVLIPITQGTMASVPVLSLVAGDVTDDNKLDSLDYNQLLDCYSDLTPAKNCSDVVKKQKTDMNDDGLVNQLDYNLFLRELSVQNGQ